MIIVIEIVFILNQKKSKPPLPFLCITSLRNKIKIIIGRRFVTGMYSYSENKAIVYLFNVWKAFENKYRKEGVTLTRLITHIIEHEVMHSLLFKCSVPPQKHENVLNVIGTGHDNKETLCK